MTTTTSSSGGSQGTTRGLFSWKLALIVAAIGYWISGGGGTVYLYYLNPVRLCSLVFRLAATAAWSTWETALGLAVPYSSSIENSGSLRTLCRNVTTDMDQLVSVFEDFLDSREDAAELRREFAAYLSHRAATSFVSVEKTLDTVLSVYKLVLPFLVFSLIGNVLSRGDGWGSEKASREGDGKTKRASPREPKAKPRPRKKDAAGASGSGFKSPASVLSVEYD